VRIEERHLKALEITGRVLGIAFFVLMAVTMHAMVGSFMGSLPAGEDPFTMDYAENPAGEINLRLSMLVRNEGIIEAQMRLKVEVLTPDGEAIGRDESSKLVPPRSTDNLTVNIIVTRDDARKYLSGGAQPHFRIFFECRTIYGLVGMGIRIEV